MNTGEHLVIRHGRNRASVALHVYRMLVEAKIDGFEIGAAGIEGDPDLVFKKEKIAVFVNDCFWHRCPMHPSPGREARAQNDRAITKNIRRDRISQERLYRAGWSVLNVWEHNLNQEDLRRRELKRIVRVLERRRQRRRNS